MRPRTSDRRGERGLTLIEVLVSFFILFVVTLAVLQLLSMAYMVNLGSMARTELMYKAQEVVETIRLQKFRFSSLMETPSALELGCCPIAVNSQMTITPGDTTCAPFWGPARANVIDDRARYTLNYTILISPADPSLSTVTVRAIPLTDETDPGGHNRYLGPVANKAVVYVAQLH